MMTSELGTSLLVSNSVYSSIVDIVPELVSDIGSKSNSSSRSSSSTSRTTEGILNPTSSFATTILPDTVKLEEEPNPFEQSFQVVAKTIKTANTTTIPKLPSVKSITKNQLLEITTSNQWNSPRSGILPSSRPSGSQQTVTRGPVKYGQGEEDMSYNQTFNNPPSTSVVSSNKRSHPHKTSSDFNRSTDSSSTALYASKKIKKEPAENEKKRKNFLERNRIAALKCRQRKKQWLQNLQTKMEYLAIDNENYHLQASALREELINLKTLLMVHKDCPINQQALKVALRRPIPGVPAPDDKDDS